MLAIVDGRPRILTLREILDEYLAYQEEVILRRLERAREELKSVGAYDYVVINGEGEVERCAGSIRSIIEAEHCSRTRMEETVGGFFG